MSKLGHCSQSRPWGSVHVLWIKIKRQIFCTTFVSWQANDTSIYTASYISMSHCENLNKFIHWIYTRESGQPLAPAMRLKCSPIPMAKYDVVMLCICNHVPPDVVDVISRHDIWSCFFMYVITAQWGDVRGELLKRKQMKLLGIVCRQMTLMSDYMFQYSIMFLLTCMWVQHVDIILYTKIS